MVEGFSAVVGGITFVILTPRIWPHALVPMAVLTVLLCGLGGLAVWGAGWGTWALLGDLEGFWANLGGWVLTALAVLAALLTAALLAVMLAQPLSGFALETVARAQERALLGDEGSHSSFLQALLTSTWTTLVVLTVGGIAYAVLFVVDFFFPPGTIVTVPLRFVIGGWLLAWNFLDYPLSLRGLGLFARLRWSARHFEEFTVFGLLWAALLFVPGLFFVILPMGVAGATRLVVAGEMQDPLSGGS